MGCEICRNENRENIEYKLTKGDKGKIPIEFKTKKTEDNIYLTKESYLEEKLNKKYSISPNTLEELKEKKTNENQINTKKDELSNNTNKEYIINTLNIYSNNTIHFGSRNKKKKEKNPKIENETIDTKNKENIIYESSNNKKENIKAEEDSTKKIKSNLRNKNDINIKKTNKVSIFLTDFQIEKKESCEKKMISVDNDKDEPNSKNNKKSEKTEKKRKLKRCNKLSDKDKGEKENSQTIKNDNNNKEEEKDKKYSEDIIFEENEDDDDSYSDSDDNDNTESEDKKKKKKRKGNFIKYSYTKQISKKTVKINLLLKDIDHSKIDKILKKAPKRKKKKSN